MKISDEQLKFIDEVKNRAKKAYEAIEPRGLEEGPKAFMEISLTVSAFQYALASTAQAAGMTLDQAVQGLQIAWDAASEAEPLN
jgi:hypothetical protein